MKTLCLVPVGGAGAPRPVRVPPPGAGAGTLSVRLGDDGSLTVTPARDADQAPQPGRCAPIAELKIRSTPLGLDWWLAPRHPSLAVNGVAPLPLAALEPGDLLSSGAAWWLVASLWTAEPRPAPAELAGRQCPVCGGPLSAANVCQCPCGRFYHLEAPDAGDNEQVLNCYLAAPCGLCGRQPTLEPTFWPEPAESLFHWET
jgi:hypothetical protein